MAEVIQARLLLGERGGCTGSLTGLADGRGVACRGGPWRWGGDGVEGMDEDSDGCGDGGGGSPDG